MADRLPPVIGGMQQRDQALRTGIIAKRAADRRQGSQLVIRNRDSQDIRADRRHASGDITPFGGRMGQFKTRAAEGPFIGDTGRQILQPGQPTPRKVAPQRRQRRHGEMPFQQQCHALPRRVIPPPCVLRADRQHPVNALCPPREAGKKAADAVAHDDQGPAIPLGHERQRSREIPLAPVPPAIAAAPQIRRARKTNAAIIPGQDLETMTGQKCRITMIIPGEHPRGRVDDDAACWLAPAGPEVSVQPDTILAMQRDGAAWPGFMIDDAMFHARHTSSRAD